MIERLYRSPFGRVLSWLAHGIARWHRPFIVYGWTDPASGSFRKYTRMSSTVTLLNTSRLTLGDHIWVGHQTVLDATGGLTIDEGCQIGSWVGVFSHGSHQAIRLLGRSYVTMPASERRGYVRKPVRIGAYTFVGSGAMILPGVSIGRGCIVGPNCVVMSDIPDHSIVAVAPSRIVGNTLDSDEQAFQEADFGETYYDPELVRRLRQACQDKPQRR